ncbi:hypothetical protein, partial [Alistipes finegoldii]|uniref:hypothetical protein n=1 Tax=Alistipes finegoldii TaxID=214856 RepID=UPI003AB3696F
FRMLLVDGDRRVDHSGRLHLSNFRIGNGQTDIANTEKYLQSAIFFFRLHAVFTGNARLYIVTPY